MLLTELFLIMLPDANIEIIQSRIEHTKSKCPACYFKKPGNDKLNLLIEDHKKLKNYGIVENTNNFIEA